MSDIATAIMVSTFMICFFGFCGWRQYLQYKLIKELSKTQKIEIEF